MNNPTEKIPDFGTPTNTESPIVNQILHEKFYVENGLSFHKYKVLNATDPIELSKSSSVCFIWRCEHSFLNTRRLFVEINWFATDHEDAALKPENFVGAAAPNCHMMIDSVGINIGVIIHTKMR